MLSLLSDLTRATNYVLLEQLTEKGRQLCIEIHPVMHSNTEFSALAD